MARMAALPIDACEDEALRTAFEHFEKTLGFVPNSLLTMQRVPAIALAVIQMNKAVFAPDSQVDLGFKRLIAHVASHASGCMYCKAHTSVSASRLGISEEKLEDVYNYQTSPHYSEKERIALTFALAAASVPNDVTDSLYDTLSAHWSEVEIVEILGVIGMFGFFNRWNDSMATPLEEEPMSLANKLLADKGWSAGKHA